MSTRVEVAYEPADAPVRERSRRPLLDERETRPNPPREGLRLERMAEPCTMVICGATGDLTERKLAPALYNCLLGGFLPPEFSVLARSLNPEMIHSMTYIGAEGREIVRPPGLSDMPGGAAVAGMMTMVLGLSLGLVRGERWIVRAACLAAAVAGFVVTLVMDWHDRADTWEPEHHGWWLRHGTSWGNALLTLFAVGLVDRALGARQREAQARGFEPFEVRERDTVMRRPA